MAGDVHVCKLDELLLLMGSASLPVTEAVLVKQVPKVGGALPVTVMVNVPPLASAPSAHWTLLPATVQPAVGELTLVTPGGTASLTTKPVLLPGPLLVTLRVQVMVPLGLTTAGPVLAMPRSTGGETQAAPSFAGWSRPSYLATTVKVGLRPAGLAIAIW